MGFFSDLKEDLSQAVNELLPDESKTGAKESRYKTLAEFQNDPDFSKLMVFPNEEEDKKNLVFPTEPRAEAKSGSRLEFTMEDADAAKWSTESESMPWRTGKDAEPVWKTSVTEEPEWRTKKDAKPVWNVGAEEEPEWLRVKATDPVWNTGAAKEPNLNTKETTEVINAKLDTVKEEAEVKQMADESAVSAEASLMADEVAVSAEMKQVTDEGVLSAEAEQVTDDALESAEASQMRDDEAVSTLAELETDDTALLAGAEQTADETVIEAEVLQTVEETTVATEPATEAETKAAVESVQEGHEGNENTIIADEAAEEGRKREMDLDDMLNDALAGGRLGAETVASQEDDVYSDGEILDETAIITGGMTITGDVASQDSMKVEGMINGNLDILGKLNVTGSINGNSRAAEIYADGAKINGEVVSEGTVKIGASSVIIGNITAKSAVVAGAVKGDIDVKGPVILDTSAIVMGNIKSKSVQINNGAVIEGMCSQCYADVNPTSFFDEYKPEIKNVKIRRD
jgi:cytoskeletal protein CcmA (bactofilin family)